MCAVNGDNLSLPVRADFVWQPGLSDRALLSPGPRTSKKKIVVSLRAPCLEALSMNGIQLPESFRPRQVVHGRFRFWNAHETLSGQEASYEKALLTARHAITESAHECILLKVLRFFLQTDRC